MTESNARGRTASDVREALDSLYGSLSLANGIGLDENVARNYRRDVPKLLSAVEKVLELEDWEYKPAVMQGYELDQAEGYNLAMKEVRAAITEALGERL